MITRVQIKPGKDASKGDDPAKREAYARLQSAVAVSRTWGDCYGYLLVATGRAEIMIDPIMNVCPVPQLPLLQKYVYVPSVLIVNVRLTVFGTAATSGTMIVPSGPTSSNVCEPLAPRMCRTT